MIKNNKLMYIAFIFLILVVIEITIVNAEIQSLTPQTKGQCVQIVQSHPNASSINVTKISYPSSCNYPDNYTIIPMNTTNNINYFYNFCNTTCLGDYVVTTCGNGDGKITCVDYNFNVSPTGFNGNLGFYIMLTIIIIGILLIGIFIKNIPITMIGSLCSVAWGIYTAMFGFNSFLNIGTQIFSIGILSFGFYWGFQAMGEYLDLL